ncbi:uncharacterized protein LAESUDRAFT_758746 [Laetiporus sulphureus 93-53]|uniref:RING-type domain-containing protein n=1 Tax=Laetiporus sulphureus 93-53 TaxID=1314785 RepID=A0A165ELW7_9APHY|nr:uncharacterized protein LAESUDRAFT_758746 [Laetiporus sulphureus 93-53]KZT07331.1 hypothetical protein LAESUDRAFT_758746 [Laetiporus sulphureus 93-53]
MADGCCSICLDELKDPVSIPCGHLHCEKCLIAHVEANGDAMKALCPTCRAEFTIANPDLRFVPAKYHEYIIPSVRRIFLDEPQSATQLKQANARLEERVRALERDKALLMERCESSMAASKRHAEGERDARRASEKLKGDVVDLQQKYEELKLKYKTLKSSQAASSSSLASKRNRSQAGLDSPSSDSDPVTSPSRRYVLEWFQGEQAVLGSKRDSRSITERRTTRTAKRPRVTLGSPFKTPVQQTNESASGQNAPNPDSPERLRPRVGPRPRYLFSGAGHRLHSDFNVPISSSRRAGRSSSAIDDPSGLLGDPRIDDLGNGIESDPTLAYF